MNWPLLHFLPPRLRKPLLWTLGILVGYTLLGFLILPPIVRAVAVRQLSKQFGREVTIQKIKLNPYALSTTIRGLLIKDKDGQPFVSWDEVYVNLQLSSFFGHPWVFSEVSTTKPFVRVQINKDYSFNFSDLITKFSTNAPPKEQSKPLALRIDRLRIAGATASLTDLTPRTPFQRTLGPIDVTLVHFRTDPSNKNPYSVAGTTDAGEKFAWSGYFYLEPLRSQGEFSLENMALNKYAPLYQDFIRFQITDGVVDVHSSYHFEVSLGNSIAWVTNTSFSLRSLKVVDSKGGQSLVELPEFKVAGASLDAEGRRAEVESITGSGARLSVRRDKDNSINVVELSKPAENAPNASGGILLLLRAVTNAVALLLNSTNAWSGTIHDVEFQDAALNVEDLANARPVRLNLDQIQFSAKHISNLPGTNLSASLSLRWNTNGAIKTDITASFAPVNAEIRMGLDKLELRPLDPYLEPKVNLFVLGSKLSMNGRVGLRVTNSELPDVTFRGDARLDDFATVDGLMAEDLLKWGSVRVSGIEARLNPEEVNIREVAVDDAFARVIIETNRTINLMSVLRLGETNSPATPLPAATGKRKKPAAPAAAATNASPLGALPKFAIGSVVISNAEIRFSDRSLKPNVNMTIKQASGRITGLSSEVVGHADVNIHAKVDNVGPAEVSGTINPLSQTGTNDIKVVVKDVDLTPTSPYVGKFAGYRLVEGNLGMELDYHLRGRKLQSENRIELDRFTFGEKVNSPDATKLPVRLAVAILKDRDGKIKLDVPIEGSLDDPQFRLHKVIVNAIVNILTKIVTSPFAALSAVFGGKGEEMGYQDFAAGSAELQPAGKEKLDALVKGLYERPGLGLEIAGSVDPDADREGLQHVALEKRLRAAKWKSLRRALRETTPPDQVTLTPEERPRWLKELYAEAVSKGEITFSTVKTNGEAGNSARTQMTSASPSARVTESRTAEAAHGAETLMQGGENKAPAPMGAVAAAGPSKRPKTADAMEQALADNIPVTDSDLEALAAERAKAVREYVLQSGKVEAQRVFFAETQSGSVKSQGSRAYVQLR